MPATAARDRDAKRIGGRILSWDFLLAIREGARGGGANENPRGRSDTEQTSDENKEKYQ